uniref:Uncharacterized protein n=1 Tax=Rhizophora mucronata TaxID=61149 RepID=A0A2P2R200_RHIMU
MPLEALEISWFSIKSRWVMPLCSLKVWKSTIYRRKCYFQLKKNHGMEL